MDRDEREIIAAAGAQGVRVHRNVHGNWVIGLSATADELTVSNPRRVDTIIGGGMIRLAEGRTFKLEMTTDEARTAFGLNDGDSPRSVVAR